MAREAFERSLDHFIADGQESLTEQIHQRHLALRAIGNLELHRARFEDGEDVDVADLWGDLDKLIDYAKVLLGEL